MNSRRTFFSKLASLVAVVALAPEIAFGAKLELPKADEPKVEAVEFFWMQTDRISACYSDDYLEALSKLDGRGIQFY